MISFFFLTLLQAASVVLAIPYNGPIETGYGVVNVPQALGWSPKPTDSPLDPLIFRRELSNTCGYISGSAADPYSCFGTSYTCSSIDTVFGCCPPSFTALTQCGLWTTCLNYTDANSCTGDCAYRKKLCTGTASPYCITYISDLYSNYECYSELIANPLTILASPTDITTQIISSSVSSSSTSTPLPSTTIPGPTSTTTIPGSPSSSTSTSSTDVGAIVGGVVGGVAGVALLVGAGVLYLMNRKKRQMAQQMTEIQT